MHVHRQAGRQSLQVHFVGVFAARLDKHLMAFLIGKAHHLILKTGAIARADALDLAAVEGRAVQILQYHLLGVCPRPRDVARQGVVEFLGSLERERHYGCLPLLHLQVGEINGIAVDTGRGTRLEAAGGDTQFQQAVGEGGGGKHTVGAAVIGHVAHENAPTQEGTRGENHRLGGILRLQMGGQQEGAVLSPLDGGDLRLPQMKVGRFLQHRLHIGGIVAAVDLSAEGMHRRAFAAVEHTALQEGGVRRLSHLAAESVDLTHQVTLSGAADGGIAGHIAHPVHINGKYDGVAPQSGGGKSCLDAGVTGADDRHVIGAIEKQHGYPPFGRIRN